MCAAPRHALVRARGASRDMPPAARGGGMFAIPFTPLWDHRRAVLSPSVGGRGRPWDGAQAPREAQAQAPRSRAGRPGECVSSSVPVE